MALIATVTMVANLATKPVQLIQPHMILWAIAIHTDQLLVNVYKRYPIRCMGCARQTLHMHVCSIYHEDCICSELSLSQHTSQPAGSHFPSGRGMQFSSEWSATQTGPQ